MNKSDSEHLAEMARWLKILGIQEIRPVIQDSFHYDDGSKARDAKIAYELTNGENSQRDIEEHIEFTYQWVSDRQKEWAEQGLVEKSGPNSPYSHIISLTEIGVEVEGLDDVLEAREKAEDENS